MTSASDQRESGRQSAPAATSKLTSTSPGASPSGRGSRRRACAGARPLARGRGAGWATGGCGRAPSISSRTIDGLPVALVALLGGVALGGDPLGLAGLLEQARRSASAVSASARRSRATGERVAVALELRESASSPWSSCALTRSTASSATLSRPGFFSPLVLRSWSALSSFLRARLVPRSAPLIDAWSRSRSAPSSRGRSLSSWWWTDAVERKKPSVGMPVSSASTWSASVGSVIDSPSSSRRTVPFAPANVFSSVPVVRAVLLVLVLEVDRDRSSGRPVARPTAGAPRARPRCSSPCGSAPARWRAGWSSCRPRSGRGRRSGRARARCRGRGSGGSRGRVRSVILTARPRGRRAAGGRGGGRRGARRPRLGELRPSPRARRSGPRGRG